MGGTLCRLVEQGHEVHIAYGVSGASAVSDDVVGNQLAFVRASGLADPTRIAHLDSLTAGLHAGAGLPHSAELTDWKGLIRRHEAIAAARVCGVNESCLHFLNLPFTTPHPAAAPTPPTTSP